MIFDDVAEVMKAKPVRQIRRMTGLNVSRIQSLRCGCTFNLDYSVVAALEKLGYTVKLEKKCTGNQNT